MGVCKAVNNQTVHVDSALDLLDYVVSTVQIVEHNDVHLTYARRNRCRITQGTRIGRRPDPASSDSFFLRGRSRKGLLSHGY